MFRKRIKLLSNQQLFLKNIGDLVVPFLSTSKDFFNLLLTCKDTYKSLQISYPYIDFKCSGFFPNHKVKYVRNLDLNYNFEKRLKFIPFFFPNCRKIIQILRNIINEDLKYLENIQHLDLRECNQITDEGLKYLNNVRHLDLRECKKITDEGLKHLKNVQYLNLYGCNQITDEGLKHLKNVNI